MADSPESLALQVLRQHGVTPPRDVSDPCVISVAMRLKLLEGRALATSGLLVEVRHQRDEVKDACRKALELAEAEGVDRYRGTDEVRPFVEALRRALGVRAGG